MKAQLETRNLELKGDAEKVGAKLDGRSFVVIRQASETGQLYGSVSPRDIVTILTDGGFTVSRGQISLNTPIKTLGLHKVPVALHPEIDVTITLNVARSNDEAERIARGENVLQPREERLVMATGEAAAEEEEREREEEGEAAAGEVKAE
jgi:large subunit ribosomal protein L9